MNKRKHTGFVEALLLCVFIRAAAAETGAEIAVFPPDHGNSKAQRDVHALQFSADGSHLLVVCGKGKFPLVDDKSIAPVATWDLGKKRLVSAWSIMNNANWIGYGSQEVPGNHVISGVTERWGSSMAPAICDSTTGTPIKPGPLDGIPKLYCTAEAVSADGAWLAIAWNQSVGPSNGTKLLMRMGSIGVWDVKARKWKWQLPGIELEAENQERSPIVNDGRADDRAHVGNLAFAPDGRRLAAEVGSELHILALEDGKQAPSVILTTELQNKYKTNEVAKNLDWLEIRTRKPHHFQWLANGTLVKQKDTAFVTLDAATGKLKDAFDLAPAKPAKPEPEDGPKLQTKPKKRRPSRPAKVPSSALPPEEPTKWVVVVQSTSLSAQAKLLAVLYSQESDELAVAIWDVAKRHQLGLLKLPIETFGKGGAPRGSAPGILANQSPHAAKPDLLVDRARTAVQIALSPDGEHLAVPDLYGVIHVFDVAQIKASTAAAKK